MLQRELPELARRLLGDGYRVMIETSGAHPLDSLPDAVVRVIDIKTPVRASRTATAGAAAGAAAWRRGEVRAGRRGRLPWAAQLIREHELGGRTEVLLSPVHGRLDPKNVSNGCSGIAFRRD
jgi:7-carboxy-7-deazaguanine synthase